MNPHRHHLDSETWLKTSQGDDRGYVDAEVLSELWFHTGTRCNLSCPFCLEGSGPKEDRLPYITHEEVRPLLKQASEMGCERFSFTGGEPFLNKEFLAILEEALELAPCLVLTNATRPLHLRYDELSKLTHHGKRLKFRVSLDHPDPEKHDQGRGEGSFEMAVEGLKRLQEMGFETSLACQWPNGADRDLLREEYLGLLRERGCSDDLGFVFFPDFHPPGEKVETPEITQDCMTRYHDEVSRSKFMCAFSRMVIKRPEGLKVSACTLVDDDDSYDLSDGDLKAAVKTRVTLGHHRCFSCFSCGASCSES
jgi:MoaA/NifB/PqqE/SkfB family radical SAM enzyme